MKSLDEETTRLILSKNSFTKMQYFWDELDSIDPQAQCSSTQIGLSSVVLSLFDSSKLKLCSVSELLTCTLRAIYLFGMLHLPLIAYQPIVILILMVILEILQVNFEFFISLLLLIQLNLKLECFSIYRAFYQLVTVKF